MKNIILSISIIFFLFNSNCKGIAQNNDLGKNSKPNIVFLFSDDQSVPDLGSYGNSVIHTPNLDLMAKESMLFTRAYVPAPQCSPTRAAILTGRSPHTTGASRLHVDAKSNYTSLIELLNDAGYFTGAYRKVHQKNIQSQFDFYGGAKKELSAFFKELPKGQPFYLWFGSRDPHRPYNLEEYDYKHDPKTVIVPDYLPDTDSVRQDIANYYNEITRFDLESGEILKLLEEYGLTDNTIVVMTSDNGMPFPRAKSTLYEPGVQVPLLIKWPGIVKEGQSTDALVNLMDLTTTWLEAAGIEVPEDMEGQSLLSILSGEEKKDIRDYVFVERNWHDNWDPMRGVIGKKYKLIQNYRPEAGTIHTLDRLFSPTWDEFERLQKEGKLNKKLQYYFDATKPVIEFYDLENDPGEWNNLADDPQFQDLIEEYQQALSDWMNKTHDFLPSPKDAFPPRSGFSEIYDVLEAEEFKK